MTLLIKGMVCNRCIYVLEKEFASLGLEILEIKLGQVVLKNTIDLSSRLYEIETMLKRHGFELMYDKNHKIVLDIKEIIEQGILMQIEKGISPKFTVLITDKLHKNYDTLSAIFSTIEGTTLEKYIILRKVEKVKELLVYTELSLTDIAFVLGYSSQAYLSNQLKKYTGFTSSYFKQIKQNKEDVMQKN